MLFDVLNCLLLNNNMEWPLAVKYKRTRLASGSTREGNNIARLVCKMNVNIISGTHGKRAMLGNCDGYSSFC